MIEYTPRDPATVTPPSAGNYRFFCTEDGNFARMDSDGNVSTLPFSYDVPGEYALPDKIVGKQFLTGLIDGAMIGPDCMFGDAGATLAALGFAYTDNLNGTCIEIPVAAGQTLKIQRGSNYSGSDGWSANYTFPVEFDDYTKVSIVATKQASDPTNADGNDIGAEAVSNTQFRISRDDFGARLCGWIAVGV